mmetsp:Transcript_992/g.1564  ORF Transcript_992/g.1564 Transcript_992/m.1564 type:complete len:434 (+) Transcript_992:119-1420(+)
MQRRPLTSCGLLAALAYVLSSWTAGTLFAAPKLPDHVRNTGLFTAQGLASGHAAAGSKKPSVGGTSYASASQVSLAAAAALVAAVAAAAGRRRSGCAMAAGKAVKETVERPASAERRDEREKGARAVPGGESGQRFFSVRNRQFWDYMVYPRTYFNRAWKGKDIGYALFFIAIHLGAAAAPFYFTWEAFAVFLIGYVITGMFGITLSYHRQLAHRSFTTPKWLEYTFAYCGALALQSHPINWVSSHRHHHGGTETEEDVHSPLDGFWWSHMGWLMDTKNTWMRQNKGNATDLQSQWFYRFLAKTYPIHAIVMPIVGLYALGGMPFVMWGFFARVVWVWHMTWMVNSVSHVWGFQDWNTGDKSMNNWVVGMLAFGEGWHNNHHAFENSCRHGLKWWMVDPTWYTIKLLSFVGLANNLKYPSEGKMRKLAFPSAA